MNDLEFQASHIYHLFLGRNPDDRERSDLTTYGLGFNGYLWMDSRLEKGDPQPGMKRLILYTSCHAEQMIVYLRSYRPDVFETHYVNILFTHRLLLHRGRFCPELIHAMFGDADKLLCNLMSSKFEELSTAALLPYCKPNCQVVSFVPPSFSAFFPVSKYYGEEPVAKGLVAGKTAGQLIREFHEGTFDCMFDERYAWQIERLKSREEDHDIGLTEFIKKHQRAVKLFFTDNHMSFHIAAYVTNLALEQFGLGGHDDPEHALKVPVNGANFANHFPEEDYSWKHYGFEYPKRFETDWCGAAAFYPSCIEDIAKRMRDPKGALARPFVPVELEK